MATFKEIGKNSFVCRSGGVPQEGEVEVAPWQEKAIMKAWEDCNFEGNIPVRWEVFTDPTDTDEDVVFYAYDKLAKHLETALKEGGMSRYELAKKSGVTMSQIGRFIEMSTDLSLDSYARIMSALGRYDALKCLYEG